MAYQTGTLDRLGQVLPAIRDFLLANGWSWDADWREALQVHAGLSHETTPPPPHDRQRWSWRHRLAMHKGNKCFAAQDFYNTDDLLYGTHSGAPYPVLPFGYANGPGISWVAGTSPAVSGRNEAAVSALEGGAGSFTDPYRLYTLDSLGNPSFGQRGAAAPDFASYNNDVNNPSRPMVCPLPTVTGMETGTWSNGDFNWVNWANNDAPKSAPNNDLFAWFGNPATGTLIPLRYWFMCDATGDNVCLMFQHDTIRTDTSRVTYMCIGDLVKAGSWGAAGDGIFYASPLAATGAFTGNDLSTYGIFGHEVNRFAGPGVTMDDAGVSLAVRMPAVDTSPAGWQYLGAPGAGRRILSTAEMFLYPGQVQGFGVKTGFGYAPTLKQLLSSAGDAAVGLEPFLTIQRDNGLQSMIGSLPHIRYANTYGFSAGTETLDKDGNTWVIFDGFMVRKFP